MKILKFMYDSTKGAIEGIGSIFIIMFLMIVFVLVLALIFGMIGYFLLGVAFPEYFTFGWYWWRFLALGLLSILV